MEQQRRQEQRRQLKALDVCQRVRQRGRQRVLPQELATRVLPQERATRVATMVRELVGRLPCREKTWLKTLPCDYCPGSRYRVRRRIRERTFQLLGRQQDSFRMVWRTSKIPACGQTKPQSVKTGGAPNWPVEFSENLSVTNSRSVYCNAFHAEGTWVNAQQADSSQADSQPNPEHW